MRINQVSGRGGRGRGERTQSSRDEFIRCCWFASSPGTLSVQEFLAIPELENNPLVNRVVSTFDTDKSGEVDFREFVKSLSVFATNETQGKEEKYKCQSKREGG